MKAIDKILNLTLFSIEGHSFHIYHIVNLVILFFATWGLLLLVKLLVNRIFAKKYGKDDGKAYAIIQICRYFIVILAVIAGINSLGFDITILLASSAALFVGLGLGMQALFSNWVSGILLWFEHNISVGDVVEFNGVVARVKDINLRTSTVETRDSVNIIIPNSELCNSHVTNWHFKSNRRTRFHIAMGVAYGSETRKVEKLLLRCAGEHKDILKNPAPVVWFTGFGESALLFELLLWTEDIWMAEQIKSDLRFAIDSAFREAGIVIPFPQRDVHVKSDQKQTSG